MLQNFFGLIDAFICVTYVIFLMIYTNTAIIYNQKDLKEWSLQSMLQKSFFVTDDGRVTKKL